MKYIKKILPFVLAPIALTSCCGTSNNKDVILNTSNYETYLSKVKNITNNNKIVAESGTASLTKEIVLPLFKSSEWSLNFKDLSIEKGHLLTFGQSSKNSKIYLTFNKTNHSFVLGVANNAITNKFYNYCFDLNIDSLEGKDCSLIFKDEQFIFKMDKEEFELSAFNVNQKNHVKCKNIKNLNSELRKQIIAITGSEHLVFDGIGSLTSLAHTFSGGFKEISASVNFDKQFEVGRENVLDGKNIFVLGSSIFYGHCSSGYAFSELIRDHNSSTKIYKETVSGTTLAIKPNLSNSYIERMENMIKRNGSHKYIKEDDALIVQLSTNDFVTGVPLGELSDTSMKNSKSFDKKTITGAIEYIIARARELNPDIEIIFVSCPILNNWGARGKYKTYNDQIMPKLAEKRRIHNLDLLNYQNGVSLYNRLDKNNERGFFFDDIHPNSLGYSCLVYPLVDNLFREIFKNR